MGRSASRVGGAVRIEDYASGGEAIAVGPYRLRVTRAADKVVHHVSANDAGGNPLPEYAIPADIVIGSGARGRSYLAVQEGAAWQTPISWFSHESKWDLSPGFDLGNGGRRAIGGDCLFCHVDRVEPVPRALNRYKEPLLPAQAAIGCERCHGPGQLHTAERANAAAPQGADTSIVNPARLPPELQASICAQCHLQGAERVPRRGREVFEFRPGLPFEQFVTVFAYHPELAEANRSVGQFEQVEQSACFAGSKGRLGCTSCHDPHATPAAAAREQFYRDRCNACHASRGCSAPPPERRAKRDSCIECHMPRSGSANIPHTSVTDHRIPRRPAPAAAPGRAPRDVVPLVAFQNGPYAAGHAERERDLGVALAWMAAKFPRTPGGPQERFAFLASDRLTVSLKAWRGDADAWLALSYARAASGDAGRRVAAADRAARLAPDSDAALAELAEAALAAEQPARAEEAATAWIRQNPTAVEPLLARAAARSAASKWGGAEADARAALAIQPLHPVARLRLALCRHHQGDARGGRKEADTAAGLATTPPRRAAMLEWYRRQTQR
jgi:hypothetical protein